MNNQKNKAVAEPMTLAQIKSAPLNLLQNQKHIIPKHLTDLHAALNDAIKAIASGFEGKASKQGFVQALRSDGSPIVGGTYLRNYMRGVNVTKVYKGQKVICDKPCCTVYHPAPEDTIVSSKKPQTDTVPTYNPEDPNAGWVKVEARSKRTSRLKSASQKARHTLYYQDDAMNSDY